ncbi:hypothetical protein ONZ45_g10971 [Pleurotus djamor]|nr:hypothetical protein ONZ45_g10971 [Pleurotus djamor]
MYLLPDMAATRAVAGIALATSSIVINLETTSEASFATEYVRLRKSRPTQATLISLPANEDPGAVIVRNSEVPLVTLTAETNPELVARLALYLSDISSLPVVLHLAVVDDLADLLILKFSIPFFLVSTTTQQSQENALLAASLARTSKKAVVHAFYPLDTDGSIDLDELVVPLPLRDASRRSLSQTVVANQMTREPPIPPKAFTNINPKSASTCPSPTNNSGDLLSQYATDVDLLQENCQAYKRASLSVEQLIGRRPLPFATQDIPNPRTVVFTVGQSSLPFVEGVKFIQLSATSIIVLEHAWDPSMRRASIYMDFVNIFQVLDRDPRPVCLQGTIGNTSQVTYQEMVKFIQHASAHSITPLVIGTPPLSPNPSPSVSKLEVAYMKALEYVFGRRLDVLTSPAFVPSSEMIATSPEFALGRVQAQLQSRDQLVQLVLEVLEEGSLDLELHSLFSKWVLSKDDPRKSYAISDQLVASLQGLPAHSANVETILSLRSYLPFPSRWIVGSEAWSNDIGGSGLHHIIASGLNVNALIIDTTPYSSRDTTGHRQRKQDVGLYGMNHGDVYVASIAIFSSYSHVLEVLSEADKFNGPSIVLAYLPYLNESTTALDVLKETKLAVDSGYWPLYRWDPSKSSGAGDPFSLDSDVIKNELREFLDRQNHISQLVHANPQLALGLSRSLSGEAKASRKKYAQKLYDEMLHSLDAPPLLVLYASDGGAAEKMAKRLGQRATARGLSTAVASMDSFSIDALAQEGHVVLLTSTAGQGEPPQNGRKFFKALSTVLVKGDSCVLCNVRYAVFAMGDSRYWPRPEDSQYYNKPGKELDARLEKLGAQRMVAIGLGDEQDADGHETGYKGWEVRLWKALGVDAIELEEAEPEPITNEHYKAASSYLRGTIPEGLEDTSTSGLLCASDTQLSKFHGVYQQDDRDIRDERQLEGLEPAYYFMIRLRMPAGVCQPHQWLKLDQLADEHGNGTMKITTRQTFQFHGVIKRHLKPAIQDINRTLLDTLSAAGDLARVHEQACSFAKGISDHLMPRTTAYHEIWLDKKLVAGNAVKDYEPLYGPFYLPRKFKIAIAVPPTNDVDVFTNDLGFIAIVNSQGDLIGYNVCVGGGMGVTHGNKKTYPRLADVIGFCTPDQGIKVAEGVFLTQRDLGDRANRKRGRVGYTIDTIGLEIFKAEITTRTRFALAPARPYSFTRNLDNYGWVTGEDGKHHFTMFIENGRVQNSPSRPFKSGLRELAKIHKGTFRLTANQHLVVSDVAAEDLASVKEILKKYNMDNLSYSGMRLSSSACVALPTCVLAMAESERYLPLLIDKVEKICEEHGLRNDTIMIRMSGCPNGCTRPYVSDIGFIGKAPGVYSMLLGGGASGQRLNKVYRESVTEPDILAILRPMIKRYALERVDSESFGDWTVRAGIIAPGVSGEGWYS